MEGGIENRNHGSAGHNRTAGLYAHDVCRIVQRRKVDVVAYGVHNAVVDKHRAGKALAAVHHAVSHCAYFAHAGNGAVFFVLKHLQHQLNGLYMVFKRLFYLDFLSAYFMGDIGALDAYALHKPLAYYRLIRHIDKLIFKGGGACVYNQNLHL